MKKIELNIVEIDQFEFPTIVNQINNDYFRPLRLAADTGNLPLGNDIICGVAPVCLPPCSGGGF